MKQTCKHIVFASLVLAVALAGVNCNKNESKSQSAELLTVEQIMARGPDGSLGGTLASDVITCTGSGVCSIIEDIGQVTIRNMPLNPDQTSPTSWQDVLLERYKVVYTRADGRNAVPEDVPYPFEASLQVNIRVNQTIPFGIILVRATAKTELPLVRLAEGPIGEDQILATANITFYGHDLSGHPVQAEGAMAIHFANWADR